MRLTVTLATFAVFVSLAFLEDPSLAQEKKKKGKAPAPMLPFPPKLPNDKPFASDTSDDFLKAPPGVLREGVVIAKTAPKVDFLYYPCQTYKAKIWSNWGDGLAVNGKYYSSLGDHNAPDGNAFVYEYDPVDHVLRLLVNIRELLQILMGYTPGKVHGRLDMGSDGWLYFSTHRGSTTTTTDRNNYKGDWIIRVDPKDWRRRRSSPRGRCRNTASRAASSIRSGSSSTAAPLPASPKTAKAFASSPMIARTRRSSTTAPTDRRAT